MTLIIDGVVIKPIGRTDPVCPSCGGILPKFPLRKIACPQCGEAIYSRVRPFDGEKCLVNDRIAVDLELQWEKYQELKGLLKLAWNSPRILAMYDSLMDGDRGRTVIDWDFVNRYFSRSPREMLEKWTAG